MPHDKGNTRRAVTTSLPLAVLLLLAIPPRPALAATINLRGVEGSQSTKSAKGDLFRQASGVGVDLLPMVPTMAFRWSQQTIDHLSEDLRVLLDSNR
jgi:hypothetical protein